MAYRLITGALGGNIIRLHHTKPYGVFRLRPRVQDVVLLRYSEQGGYVTGWTRLTIDFLGNNRRRRIGLDSAALVGTKLTGVYVPCLLNIISNLTSTGL